jgi:hypothetical protein
VEQFKGEITDLQKRLQDANFGKNRLKEQVEGKDGFVQLQDMVTKLLQNIFQRS